MRTLDYLQQDLILGMDWLRDANPQIDWLGYTVTIQNADGTPVVLAATLVDGSVRIELCSIKAALATVSKHKTIAWFGLLRGSSPEEGEDHHPQSDQLGDPHLYK